MNLQALARMGSAMLLGLLVAMILLLTMQSLILRDSGDAIAPAKLRMLDFLPRVTEQSPEQVRPEPPKPVQPPPPTAPPSVAPLPPPEIALDPVASVPLDLPDIRQSLPLRLDLDVQQEPAAPPVQPVDSSASDTTLRDRDVQPLVRVEPLYPRSARRRGIEGSVLVEFTVTADGNTRDVRIIESEPEGIFDNAALSAARQFRFQPRVVDGQAVEATGVRNRITFRLE